ncbi:MAG: DNA polymerase/3'-5' exonuclease PolX [Anaerolineae bacterium]
MTNQEIAQIFYELADMLEVKGENRFRVRAFRKAADQIAGHVRSMADIAAGGTLEEIPGVGEAIAKKIVEILESGQLTQHRRLRAEIPTAVTALLSIPDVGPRTARLIWESLGLETIDQVEMAAETGELRKLKGLGPKMEQTILEGIQRLRARQAQPARVLLGDALPVAERLLAGLGECPAVQRADAAGSLRRLRPTVGDIDLLAASDSPQAVTDYFVELPEIARVQSHGDTKASVILHNGLQVDLYVLPREEYGSLLQHFTGSKRHNIELRELALSQGLSFSEHGFKQEDGSLIRCETEEEVYGTLGLPWIPPELREAQGEFAAAKQGRLPHLIENGDVRGDLQMHTDASDGHDTLAAMARAAVAKGYEYIAVTDHSQGLGIVQGLSPERVREQRELIDALNEELAPFRVLAGIELEIRVDGTLALPDDVLAELDIVLASVHTSMRQDRETMTRRVVAAMHNPHVHIIAHPTGRLINQRDRLNLDFDAVLLAAEETGTILEINAQPNRLDLDGEHARAAIEAGVLLSLGTDAHSTEGLGVMPLGVAMARRGWVEGRHVVNTRPLADLLEILGRKDS